MPHKSTSVSTLQPTPKRNIPFWVPRKLAYGVLGWHNCVGLLMFTSITVCTCIVGNHLLQSTVVLQCRTCDNRTIFSTNSTFSTAAGYWIEVCWTTTQNSSCHSENFPLLLTGFRHSQAPPPSFAWCIKLGRTRPHPTCKRNHLAPPILHGDHFNFPKSNLCELLRTSRSWMKHEPCCTPHGSRGQSILHLHIYIYIYLPEFFIYSCNGKGLTLCEYPVSSGSDKTEPASRLRARWRC